MPEFNLRQNELVPNDEAMLLEVRLVTGELVLLALSAESKFDPHTLQLTLPGPMGATPDERREQVSQILYAAGDRQDLRPSHFAINPDAIVRIRAEFVVDDYFAEASTTR